jgi:hypothetical protein
MKANISAKSPQNSDDVTTVLAKDHIMAQKQPFKALARGLFAPEPATN